MASYGIPFPPFANAQHGQALDDMDLEQQVTVHVAQSTSQGSSNGGTNITSTYAYQYHANSTLAPPSSTLHQYNSSGYLSDGPSVPGAFSLRQVQAENTSSFNDSFGAPSITVTPPQQSLETPLGAPALPWPENGYPTLAAATAHASGGGSGLVIRTSSGERNSRRSSRTSSPTGDESEVARNKRRIIEQRDPLREFELQKMKLVNLDQSQKIQQQAQQIEAGMKFVQDRETEMKQAEMRWANEVATLRMQMEATAKERGKESKAMEDAEKARKDELGTLQRKIEETEKMIKQLHDRYLDVGAEVRAAKLLAATANEEKLEAEATAAKLRKELEAERMGTAKRIAEVYRGFGERGGRRVDDEEEAIAGMLFDEVQERINEDTDIEMAPHSKENGNKRCTPIDTGDPSWKPATAAVGPAHSQGQLEASITKPVLNATQIQHPLEHGHLSRAWPHAESPSLQSINGPPPRIPGIQSAGEPADSAPSSFPEKVPKPIASRRVKSRPPPSRFAPPCSPPGPATATDLNGLSTDDKLNLMLKIMFHGEGKSKSYGRPLFKKPVERRPKPEGRNERNTWVRDQMNAMLRIKKDEDILKYGDEVYADNTGLQRKIASYAITGNKREGPSLTPMQVDWKDLNGRWNVDLFDLFKEFAEEDGYAGIDGVMGKEEEGELKEIFFGRLKRLRGVINANRTQRGETEDQAQRRIQARKNEVGGAKRRNTRREGLYVARNATIFAKSPDPTISIEDLAHNKKAWLDALRMHQELGLAGQSSDDSMPDSDTYFVREVDWRAPEIVKRYDMVAESSKSGYTESGKRRSGNKPRKRTRRKGYAATSRQPPAGLPINFYDPTWYMALSSRQQRDLEAKEEMVFLTHANDTMEG